MPRGAENTGPQGPPPSKEAVAWRAVCLHAVVIRAEFEYAFQLSPDPEAPEVAGLAPRVRALAEWMTQQGIRGHLSPLERDYFFAVPLGEWEQQAVLDASWRKESLGVLLWALSCVEEVPPYDHEFPEQVHLEHIGWLRPAVDFFTHIALRPQEEIARARDVAELWHWRATTTRLQREQARLAKRYNLPQIIREAATKAHANGDIPAPIAGDFPALGKSYAKLKDQDFRVVLSIAMERHLALNWLCGHGKGWEETPTDT